MFKHEFDTDDVIIINKEMLHNGFLNVSKYTFKHKLFKGGWGNPVDRELLERGNACSLLAYDPITDEVVLIEQFRVGAIESVQPWQLEIIAGMIDDGETPENTVIREAVEEAGIHVENIRHIFHYYPSVGGCSETMDIFIGQVNSNTAKGLHGLESENEDIKVHVVTRETALEMVNSGIIKNGATIMALLWLENNRNKLY